MGPSSVVRLIRGPQSKRVVVKTEYLPQSYSMTKVVWGFGKTGEE